MTRTVLITGGAGFIGSNLTRRLVGNGDEVRILDDLSIGQAAYRGTSRTSCCAVRWPIRQPFVGRGRGRCRRPPGGAGRIDDSVRDPLGTFEANVAWSVSLLEAARLAYVRRFVFASSNAAAGDHPPRATRPTSPTRSRPTAPRSRRSRPTARRTPRPSASPHAPCGSRMPTGHIRPQAERGGGLVALGLTDARSRSTATAGRPATSSTPTTWPRRSRRRSTRRRTTSPARAVPGGHRGRDDRGRPRRGDRGRRRRPVEVRHAPARPGDIGRNVARVDKAVTVLGYRAVAASGRARGDRRLVRHRARGPRARCSRGTRRVRLRVTRPR